MYSKQLKRGSSILNFMRNINLKMQVAATFWFHFCTCLDYQWVCSVYNRSRYMLWCLSFYKGIGGNKWRLALSLVIGFILGVCFECSIPSGRVREAHALRAKHCPCSSNSKTKWLFIGQQKWFLQSIIQEIKIRSWKLGFWRRSEILVILSITILTFPWAKKQCS